MSYLTWCWWKELITYLKVKGNVQDTKLLYIKVNSNGCLVVVTKDVVSKSIDETSLSNSDVSNKNTFSDTKMILGSHDISITVVSDTSFEATLLIWSLVCIVSQREDGHWSFTPLVIHSWIVFLLLMLSQKMQYLSGTDFLTSFCQEKKSIESRQP